MLSTSENVINNHQGFSRNKAVMLIIDPGDGAIVDASIGACEYYGYSLENLTAMSIFEINTMSKADLAIEMEAVCKEEKNHFDFPTVLHQEIFVLLKSTPTLYL